MKPEDFKMVICPMAVLKGCDKCPIVEKCPLKDIIGNPSKPAADSGAEPPSET